MMTDDEIKKIPAKDRYAHIVKHIEAFPGDVVAAFLAYSTALDRRDTLTKELMNGGPDVLHDHLIDNAFEINSTKADFNRTLSASGLDYHDERYMWHITECDCAECVGVCTLARRVLA